MRCVALLPLLALPLAGTLAAQSAPTGRLEGTVSGPPSAVRGATVEAVRVQPEPVLTFVARVDDRGRYRFDSLPPGDYALHPASPRLDSLALVLPERPLSIASGQRASVDFALPSADALRDAVCPGVALGGGRGVVAGRASDADTDRPLAGATVVVSWRDLTVDKATLKANSEERVASVASGDRGEFRLCGVPTGTSLSLQLQQGERAGAEVKVTVSDDEGVATRDLSLSVGPANPIAVADSIPITPSRPANDTAITERPTESATLIGTVRGVGGRPLANAELRVAGAPAVAVSDATGRFTLAALPAGTQMLVARRIGYEVFETPVELRAGRVTQRDVQLPRVVSLDSIRVVAIRSRYPEFDLNRKVNPFGFYLGPDELARRKGAQPSELLTGVPGVTIEGHGHDAVARSVHGRGSCKVMRVIVNGFQQGMALNDLPASAIAAMEIYTQGAFAPSEYAVRGSCGIIVIWTKRGAPTSAPKSDAAPRPAQ